MLPSQPSILMDESTYEVAIQVAHSFYTLNYMVNYLPKKMLFTHNGDIKSAKDAGYSYCLRFGLKFLSVRPLFGNVENKPIEHNESAID